MDPKAKIITSHKETIESILDEWGFAKYSSLRDKKRSQIVSWLNNFTPSEIEYAILLLSNIQYKDSHFIQEAISSLAKEIINIFNGNLNNVKFFPLGESPSSSGGMYLYEFRKELGLSENNFPYTPFKDHLNQPNVLVFFDDIIGSGSQAIWFAETKLQNIKIDIYYFSIFAYEEGLEKVRNSKLFKKVLCEQILSDEERAFTNNSYVFRDVEIREKLKKLSEKYGNLLFPKHPLGYDNSQSLLVFPHNTPNNTLPILWASENNEKVPGVRWNPVWERKKKIIRKDETTVVKNLKVEKVSRKGIFKDFDSEVITNNEKITTNNSELQFDSNKLEIGSKAGIEKFKELYKFAYESSGLNMNSELARAWAFNQINKKKNS